MIGWANLNPAERETMSALAAMHREYGPDALFTSDAIGMIAGRSMVAELGFLRGYGLVDFERDAAGVWGYGMNGEGFAILPASEDRSALAEHREAADQKLREEQ